MFELDIGKVLLKKIETGEKVPLPVAGGGEGNYLELTTNTEKQPIDKDGKIYSFEELLAIVNEKKTVVVFVQGYERYTLSRVTNSFMEFVNNIDLSMVTYLFDTRGKIERRYDYTLLTPSALSDFIVVEEIYNQDITLEAGKATNISVPAKDGYTAICLSYCRAGSESSFYFRMAYPAQVKVRNIGNATQTLPVSISVVYLRNY